MIKSIKKPFGLHWLDFITNDRIWSLHNVNTQIMISYSLNNDNLTSENRLSAYILMILFRITYMYILRKNICNALFYGMTEVYQWHTRIYRSRNISYSCTVTTRQLGLTLYNCIRRVTIAHFTLGLFLHNFFYHDLLI